ncbi:TniQ family protein [Rhizobium beringeri]
MRLLPVAPRPFDDELLTSWQCRVACRYSSTPPKIEFWLGRPPIPMRASFKARDFQPDKDMTWRWARASRLKEPDLQRLALCDLQRSEDCYVTNPLDRGVCPVCLDADAEKGGDHYCRRNWAHVEAAVCGGAWRGPAEHLCGFYFPISIEALSLKLGTQFLT